MDRLIPTSYPSGERVEIYTSLPSKTISTFLKENCFPFIRPSIVTGYQASSFQSRSLLFRRSKIGHVPSFTHIRSIFPHPCARIYILVGARLAGDSRGIANTLSPLAAATFAARFHPRSPILFCPSLDPFSPLLLSFTSNNFLLPCNWTELQRTIIAISYSPNHSPCFSTPIEILFESWN